MGWKNVKSHYGINHHVSVAAKGICVGSAYVHDLIVIADTDKPPEWHDTVNHQCVKLGHNLSIWRPTYLGRGEPFDGIVKAMSDDPATLRRLIDAPDTFERSLPVYTYDYDGNIIEKLCEEYGWPNVTHDGDMMYENTFSADREQVIKWARSNLSSAVKSTKEAVEQAESDLDKQRKRLSRLQSAQAKLSM